MKEADSADNKLRILLSAYACEPNRGSEPGVGWHWASELAKMGHQVWVLTRLNNRKAIQAALQALGHPKNLAFIYHDLPWWLMPLKKILGTHLYYSIWQRTALKPARAEHERHQFQCVHHLTFGSWRQATYLGKLGAPLLVGPVGGAEVPPLSLVRSLPLHAQVTEGVRYLVNLAGLFNPAVRRALLRARVISKTRDTQRWLQRMGVDSEISLEIGIDAALMVPADHDQRNGPLRLIFVGRLLGWKGVLLAIRAVALARSAGTDTTLTIVGDGRLRSECKKLIASSGAQSFINLIGSRPQSQLFQMLSDHDALLFPSMHDSSGNVVLEAFGHGLPVICLDLGGPAALVDDQVGIVVSTNGKSTSNVVCSLAKAIADLESNPELLRRLALGARQRALVSSWTRAVHAVYGLPQVSIPLSFDERNA